MDQLVQLNRRYDELPELWRFPVVLTLLMIVGAINMGLTIGSRFPFGLLVLLAVLVLAAIRLPYLLGPNHLAGHGAEAIPPPGQPPADAGFLDRWNHWYESFPELWRFQMIVWVLVVVGALNLALTIAGGFPFGLLVLLAIIGIAAVRAPYVLGWGHKSPAAGAGSAPATMALAPPDAAPSAATLQSAPPEPSLAADQSPTGASERDRPPEPPTA